MSELDDLETIADSLRRPARSRHVRQTDATKQAWRTMRSPKLRGNGASQRWKNSQSKRRVKVTLPQVRP